MGKLGVIDLCPGSNDIWNQEGDHLKGGRSVGGGAGAWEKHMHPPMVVFWNKPHYCPLRNELHLSSGFRSA